MKLDVTPGIILRFTSASAQWLKKTALVNICTVNAVLFCQQYPALSAKRATKSWRHPLRKPTARAVPTAVKQQAASDDGGRACTHAQPHFSPIVKPHEGGLLKTASFRVWHVCWLKKTLKLLLLTELRDAFRGRSLVLCGLKPRPPCDLWLATPQQPKIYLLPQLLFSPHSFGCKKAGVSKVLILCS